MSNAGDISRRVALATGAVASVAAGGTALAQEGRGQGSTDPAAKGQARQAPDRMWRFTGPFASGQEAAAYSNAEPPQGPGEASFCCMDGQFYLFWYY